MAKLLIALALLLVSSVLSARAYVPAVEAPHAGLQDYAYVPSRGLMHRECVHHVPDNALLVETADGGHDVLHQATGQLLFHVPLKRCPPPPLAAPKESRSNGDNDKDTVDVTPYQGWNAYVDYIQTKTYDTFFARWNIPAAPKTYTAGKVVFYFNGLQDSSASKTIDIIQPVIQYGQSAAGGAGYWGVASWYVDSTDQAFHSTLKQIPANSNIIGNMTRLNSTCWFIGATDGSVQSPLSICKRATLINQPSAYVTCEAYAASCANYPPAGKTGQITFTSVHLTDQGGAVSPTWQRVVETGICGNNVTVVSPSTISIGRSG